MTRSPARLVKPTLLVLLLLAGTALAGCHDIGATTRENGGGGSDWEEEEPADEEEPVDDAETIPVNETPPATRLELDLALSPVTGPVYPGDALNLSFVVKGDEADVSWAGIRWSLESTAGRTNDTLLPDAFEGGEATNVEDPSVPGEYVVGWSLPKAQTHYLRAHVETDGFHYWSDEFTLEVTPIVEEGDFEANETVRMRTNLLNPCEGDGYSDDPLEIAPGDVVQWRNAASCAHTATHDAADPLWNTGQIEPNEDSSNSYRFNKPGVYDVRCDNHPEMQHQIIVDADI